MNIVVCDGENIPATSEALSVRAVALGVNFKLIQDYLADRMSVVSKVIDNIITSVSLFRIFSKKCILVLILISLD